MSLHQRTSRYLASAVIAVQFVSPPCDAQEGLPVRIEEPDRPGFGNWLEVADYDHDGDHDVFAGWLEQVDVDEYRYVWTLYEAPDFEPGMSYVGVGKFFDDWGGFTTAEVVPDLDGDKKDELAIGEMWGMQRFGEDSGTFRIVSTQTGETLYRRDGKAPLSDMGRDITRLDDLNGNLVDEIAYVESRRVGRSDGMVRVIDGATLEEVMVFTMLYPRRIQQAEDLDGDRVKDLLVGMHPRGSSLGVQGISGASGTSFFFSQDGGYHIVPVGDHDRDLIPDYVTTQGPAFLPDVVLSSGATGQEIGRWPYAAYRRGLVGGDIDLDGDLELLLQIEYPLMIEVLEEDSWEHLNVRRRYASERISSDDYGQQIAVGDTNADGRIDLLVGSGYERRLDIFSGSELGLHVERDEFPLIMTMIDTFAGAEESLVVSDCEPGTQVYLLSSESGGGCTLFGERCVDLEAPLLPLGSTHADALGNASFTLSVPKNAQPGRLWIQAVTGSPSNGTITATSNVTIIDIL